MSRPAPPLKIAILEKAVRHFGLNGFDGASTREIAQDCDTPMSSITYHFGSKEGLYLAVAEHISAMVLERLALCFTRAMNAATQGKPAAQAALLDMLEQLAGLMLDPSLDRQALFVTREQQTRGPAFEKLYDGFLEPLVRTILSLILACRPDLSERQAKAIGTFLVGQVTVLRTAKATVTRAFEVPEYTPDITELLMKTLRQMVENAIGQNALKTGN